MFSAAGSANGSDVILKRQSVHTPIDIKDVFWNQKNDSATRIADIAGKKKKSLTAGIQKINEPIKKGKHTQMV